MVWFVLLACMSFGMIVVGAMQGLTYPWTQSAWLTGGMWMLAVALVGIVFCASRQLVNVVQHEEDPSEK